MPKCDICSKVIDHSEMRTVSGSKVSEVTARGFVPRNLAAHSAMKLLEGLFGAPKRSDVDTWKFTVSQNRHSDWGLCSNCAVELESY
jgi:hypothetical protein